MCKYAYRHGKGEIIFKLNEINIYLCNLKRLEIVSNPPPPRAPQLQKVCSKFHTSLGVLYQIRGEKEKKMDISF